MRLAMLHGVTTARLEAVASELEAERHRHRQQRGSKREPRAESCTHLPTTPTLLAKLAHAHSDDYRAATPFPHAGILHRLKRIAQD